MNISILKTALAAVVLLSISACTNENNQDAQIAALYDRIRDIEKENEELRNQNEETGLIAEKPTSEYSNKFLMNFCSLLKPSTSLNDLAAYTSNMEMARVVKDQLEKASAAASDCQFSDMKLYDHPFDIAEFKTNDGYLYVQATYDKDFNVKRFMHIPTDVKLELQVHSVPTRDGETLTTYVVHKAGLKDKIGSIFLRTPYMVYGHYVSYVHMALAYNKALIVQANRGSHNSTGQFEWLAKQNIDDSYDSLSLD